MKKAILVISIVLLSVSCIASKTISSEIKDDWITFEEIRISADIETEETNIEYEKYDSYTFFLIPDYRWINKENKNTIVKLYNAFKEFGDYIRDNNVAIWFGTPNKPITKISFDFVHKFKKELKLNGNEYLDVNRGPYIVYIKPKRITEVKIISTQKNDVITRKINRKKLEDIKINESYDYMILDISELEIECATHILNSLKEGLRFENEDDFKGSKEFQWVKKQCMAIHSLKILAKNVKNISEPIFPFIKLFGKIKKIN